MFLFKKAADLGRFLQQQKDEKRTIGFVPTMGALHKGHTSLINRSKSAGHITVCSIFVNPAQFNNTEDLEKYPRTIEADIAALASAQCDILFFPSVDEMYPQGVIKRERDFGFIGSTLEGSFRAGHFDGVAEVVQRLLNHVQPDELFLGRKDYQQCLIIAEMIKQESIALKLTFVETMREPDGLAMSSRNKRLDENQRKDAVVISETLKWMKANFATTKLETLKAEAWHRMAAKMKPEYVEVVNAQTLEPVRSSDEPLIALIAAWCGSVRLIDNMLLSD